MFYINYLIRFFVLFIILLYYGNSFAHDYNLGSINISHPWSKASPKGADLAAGFFKIKNDGKDDDRLISASSDISNHTEIHEMKMEGDVMKMRAIEKGLVIPSKETIELKPGSYHIMFIDLKQPITKGKNFKGKLVFEKAGEIEVEYQVEDLSSKDSHH